VISAGLTRDVKSHIIDMEFGIVDSQNYADDLTDELVVNAQSAQW
jgi:hypothetical protein